MTVDNVILLISAIGGLSGFTAFVWFFVSLKSKLKYENADVLVKEAEADIKDAEADGKIIDNMERFCLRIEKSNDELNKKIDEMRKALLQEREDRYHAEYHYCGRIMCKDRVPELGTYNKSSHNKKQHNNTETIENNNTELDNNIEF